MGGENFSIFVVNFRVNKASDCTKYKKYSKKLPVTHWKKLRRD